MKIRTIRYTLRTLLIGIMVVSALSVGTAEAADVDELREKIDEQNSKIEQLEAEIKQYETQIEEVGKEKQSLESAIETLDISRRKLSTNISLTEQRIETTELEIQEIAFEIQDTERRINQNTDAIGESIRNINLLESQSMVEQILSHDNLSEFWEQLEATQRFQLVMRQDMKELALLKKELEEKQLESEQKKIQFSSYKGELANQKSVLDLNRTEKNELLAATANEEANYRRLLEEKEAQREAFEQELFEFESQLRIAIDPSSIPPAGKGVLAWPLDSVTITQRFGRTVDSQRLYVSGTHNGVDFRAAMGTRIKAALSGVIEAVGNTDAMPGCYSFGKWVLIRHHNGLSTLYGHLSVVNVSAGDTVSTGSVIGYSGNTGYSTGPHLHFGLYASQGVQAMRYQSSTPCNGALMPLADRKAYLDPLEYL